MDRPQQSGLHVKEHRQLHGAPSGGQRRNFKLLVDPQLKKGQEKLIRYDGEFYNSNNHGQRPVVVRDPRTHSTKLWSRREKVDLPVPRYKVDEWYLGAVPPREITFSKLNDNVTKQFMEQLCGKYGKLERVKVYHHPKTGKHMGLAKVVFASIKSASICIERLHRTSIMGNVINAELDSKGEILKKLHHKIIKGELVADTMPDVIKHTQEKPKSRPRKISSHRRKSSVDDPRRKSIESLERQRSVDQSSAAGPRTPPINVPPANELPDSRVPPVHPPEHLAHSVTNHSPHPHLNLVPNAHSLESGYGSHPGSASMIPDQVSPFGMMAANPEHPDMSNHDDPTYAEHTKFISEAKSKILKYGNESKLKVWTKDLQNRIESLINEQNEKYNLAGSKKPTDVKNDRGNDDLTPRDRHSLDEGYDLQGSTKHYNKTPEDLEDGECSGDDGAEGESPAPIQTTQTLDERLEPDATSPALSKKSPPAEVSESLRQRFSRSPSPSFRFPHEHSPRMRDRLPFDGRPDRYSPPPAEFFHRRVRPPNPGRPPVEFGERNFHGFGVRPPSPSFGMHRRHSPPFDGHHRPPRSPGFDHHHHHHHHHHRHRFSPPRRRPPSPGFPRHRDMRPGPPEFVQRRSPSPGFRHPRRSPSPMRKLTGPLIRREFDFSPHRDRMFYSPRDAERHHGGYSPRHPEYDRHRRKSPDMRRRSPEPIKLREHRELPSEFRDRWSHHGPPSPHHGRMPSHSSRHSVHPQRSKSSSPETLQSTPPRIRSPARMRPDQKPYSPGDLPMDDSLASASIDASQAAGSDSDSETLSRVSASKRKERESSDHDVPLISLDERLREITGEPPPEEPPADSSPKVEEKAPETNHHISPPASEDMEISSGGGSSEHGDHPAMHFKQPPQPEMGFRPRGFRPPFPGPHDQPWRCNGPGPQMMWNEFNNPRFHMNQRPMWRPPPDNMMRFPPNMHNGFPQPMMNHPPMDRNFNNQMLPPPPPGWNRPWVQGHSQPMGPMNNFEMNKVPVQMPENQAADPKRVLSDCVLGRITNELKDIIKRDLNKKVIETMAFKAYEAWWDKEEALKNPKLVTASKSSAVVTAVVKIEPNCDENKESKPDPETKSSKVPALLNTFDPLNWAKGSFEMDGFRIGLGFRSAISKMPSFRVKKRTPSPTSVPEKKIKLNQKSKVEKEKPDASRKRILLDSEGEEEDESEQESSDDEEEEEESKHEKSRVLHVEDVFSSSSGSEEEESTEEEEEDESEDESEEEEQVLSKTPKKLDSIGVKRSPSPTSQEPPRKKHRIDDEVRDFVKTEKLDDSVSLAAASLSEMHSGTRLSSSLPPGSASSEKDFRHVHPKKRYRMLSKDETHNLDLIAEVSNRLRSDDEVSTMSDKEKAALEVLQEMKTTPERRASSTNRYSESSDSMDVLHPATPSRQANEGFLSPFLSRRSVSTDSLVPADSNTPANKSSLPPLFNQSKKSENEELEAVEALLSIKQSHSLLPPISPTSSAVQEDLDKAYKLSEREQIAMAALAEEHNYFASSLDHKPQVDPAILHLLEEHNYSLPPSQEPKPVKKRGRLHSRSEALYEFPPDDHKSAPSAAEIVKLRRKSKTSKRTKPRFEDDLLELKGKPPKFRSRSQTEQSALLYLIWSTGLDLEDMRYLREEYEELLTQSNVPQWANDTHWTAHPVTNIPNPESSPASKKSRRRRNKKKSEQNDDRVHETGCARSEGYYKVADKTKLIQRRLMYRHADNSEPATARQGKSAASSSGATGTENTREARHMMRRIAYEFGSDASDLLKYNQLMFRKKSVKFKRSQIHGWGLFAQETIGADEMVIEYVGQLVRSLVADRREAEYTKRGIGSSYLFRIDSDHIIDATKCGNYARFMNHSCDPSCYAKVITVEGAKKIVIYSKNVIKPTEEITYDYKFPIEDTKIPCFCGAINCRGTLN